jgi:hypothetical protein
MIKAGIALMIAVAGISGCAATVGEGKGEQTEARRKYELARQLESSSNIREAAHEYLIVAENYPRSDVWHHAVRKTGVLYTDPRNSGRNDSIALRWLGIYDTLSVAAPEKDLVQANVAALARAMGLEKELELQRRTTDSLAGAVRRMSASLVAQSRQTEELEVRLQKTADELKKLKEIDVRTSRKKRGP